MGARPPSIVPGVRPGPQTGIRVAARRPVVSQLVRPGVHAVVRIPPRSGMAVARPSIPPLSATKGMKGLGKGGKDAGKMNGKSRKFKTDLCRHFQQGSCVNGDSCPFAHGEKEREAGLAMQLARLNQQVEKFKTRLCNFYKAGHCGRGENCSFAHGDEELESWRQDVSETGVFEHKDDLGPAAPLTPPMPSEPRLPAVDRASSGVGQEEEEEEEWEGEDAGDWDWDWDAEGDTPGDAQALEEGSLQGRKEADEAVWGIEAAFADLKDHEEDDPAQGQLAPQTPPSPEGDLNAAPCTPPGAA